MNQNIIFNDFKPYKKVEEKIIDQYSSLLPNQILDIWKQYGFGSFLNGYLKIINPNCFKDILEQSYFRAKVSIPIFTTGLGDIINLEEGKYIRIVKYRKGDFTVIPTSFKLLFSDLADEEFCNRHLDWEQYLEAIKTQGIPSYDECFGYVPLLGLGGSEKAANLEKVKLAEHILVIHELLGPIQ